MNIIKHRASESFKSYSKQLQKLKKSYNAYNKLQGNDHINTECEQLPEKQDFSDLSLCYVFSIQGIGRVSVEQMLGNEKMAIITFAVIVESERKKGYMKKILSEAREYFEAKGVILCCVQLNDLSEKEQWGRLGFNSLQTTKSGSLVLISESYLQELSTL